MSQIFFVRVTSRFFLATGVALFIVGLLGLTARAAFDDAQFDGSGDKAIISLATGNYTVIGAAESFEVSENSFVATLVASSRFTVYSPGKRTFSVTADGADVTFSCDPDQSKLLVEANGSHSVTITPNSESCASLGQGGGGGSSPPPPPPPPPASESGGGSASAPPPPPPPPVAEAISAVTPPPAVPAIPQSVEPAMPSIGSLLTMLFTRDLTIGDKGEDVKTLQALLNNSGFPIADSGPGSKGQETIYFGSKTAKALAALQRSRGISPASGYFGPKTRESLAGTQAASESVAPTVPVVSSLPTPGTFTRRLVKGMSHADIRRLQVILNSDAATRIAESGLGAPGNETDYFGSLTEQAIRKFQEKYGLARAGDPGFGEVGPQTRAKLNKLFGGVPTSNGSNSVPPASPAPAVPSSEASDLRAMIEQIQQRINNLGQ